jgi:hypothetical protein
MDKSYLSNAGSYMTYISASARDTTTVTVASSTSVQALCLVAAMEGSRVAVNITGCRYCLGFDH